MIVDAGVMIGVSEPAKALGIKQNKMVKELRGSKILQIPANMSKYESASFEVERIIKNVDSYAKKDGHDTWVFRADRMIKQKRIKTD